MSLTKYIHKFFGIIFIIISFGLSYALYLAVSNYQYDKNFGNIAEVTQGKVIDVSRERKFPDYKVIQSNRRFRSHLRKIIYYRTIEFQIGGSEKSKVIDKSQINDLRVGQNVNIFYDPNNLSNIHVDEIEFTERELKERIFIIAVLLLVFFITGLMFLLGKFKTRKHYLPVIFSKLKNKYVN